MVHGLLSRSTEADPAGPQAPVAQGIEHSPSKRDAARSNRAGGTEEESWLPVVGFEGLYEVSDLGRVRRILTRGGRPTRRILKPSLTSGGYPQVRPSKDNRGASRAVHLLVADAFIGPRGDDEEVDHVDGVKTNPRLDNLEVVTPKENIRRKNALGLAGRRGRQRNFRCARCAGALCVGPDRESGVCTFCRDLLPDFVYDFVAAGLPWSVAIGLARRIARTAQSLRDGLITEAEAEARIDRDAGAVFMSVAAAREAA